MKTGLTQAQRSAATRRKLLDAAAEVLIDQGYASLTTTRFAGEPESPKEPCSNILPLKWISWPPWPRTSIPAWPMNLKAGSRP